MPLAKIPLKPGFNKQATASQAMGEWIDGNNVRFRFGSPEKLGGWEQITDDLIVGAARAQWSWTDLTGRRYAALGTNKCLYVYDADSLYDITPLDLTRTLTGCTFTSTTSSATVTVNKASHGLEPGDLFIFDSGTITLPGGGVTTFVTADFTTNTFEVLTVPTSNTFTITMPVNEAGTGMTAQGTGALTPYYIIGPLISALGYGWGTGIWGGSTWGTPRTTSNATIDGADWSLDNFGENLIATIKNGKTFIWYPTGGTGTSTRAALIPNNPTSTIQTIVSDRDRHLLHLGTETTIGNPATQDPMFIRFSDQEDIEVYEPTSTNTAGTFRLDDGTTIIGAVRAKDYILVVTDTAAYTIQFVGPPFTFSIRKVGSNCGLIGKHALAFVNGAVFWMGDSGGFFKFDGTVTDIPCLVEDFVFKTVGTDNLGINFAQGGQVYCGLNTLYTEINWFYCKAGSTNIDRLVTLNYDDSTWTTGDLARTTYEDSKVFKFPYATKYEPSLLPTVPVINGVTTGASYYFAQEKGKNEVLNLSTGVISTNAISCYVRSGDFELDVEGNGEYFLKIRRFIPDFKNLEGSADVTIYLRSYPADTTVAKGETYIGPFTIDTSTDKVDTRARARLASIRIESEAIDDNWRYGIFRVDIQPDGRGGSFPQT
jgi:hypothetical protein